jgi:adenylate kinase family enzyme
MDRPPLRIGIIGPADSGKTTHAKMMAERANVPRIDFQVMLAEHIQSLPTDAREEAEAAIADNGNAPLSIVNELSQSLFTSQPYALTGFIAENFPAGKANTEFLIAEKLHLDTVIHLKCDQEVLGARVIRTRQLKNAKENLKTTLTDDEVKAESDEISDRVVKMINQADEVASLIEALSSIPVVELNANRFIRAIASDITEKTRNIIEYVSSSYVNIF